MARRDYELFDDIGRWSEQTFGTTAERGPVGPLKHIVYEVEGELLAEDPTDITEQADVLILLMDAVRRSGHTWRKLLGAAERKMEINKTRTYRKPVGDEVSEHDRTKE